MRKVSLNIPDANQALLFRAAVLDADLSKSTNPSTWSSSTNSSKNIWIDALIKKFENISKRQEGIKEVLNYMKKQKK